MPPHREDYLRSVTIGEVKPHDATIHLADYDSSWPSQYERLARLVTKAIPGQVLLLEHVGSTSVPGLAAKPIIDMVLAVPSSADEAAYVPRLEEEGFVLRIREPEWFQHRALKFIQPASNLHVFTAGCEEIGCMLMFRDRLRAHEDERLLYERTKRDLAQRTWKHVQDYADAKTAVVREILGRAGD
jgi:GrpB-like predicted nucleotidyltransferase (UPF0157 family)